MKLKVDEEDSICFNWDNVRCFSYLKLLRINSESKMRAFVWKKVFYTPV